MNELFIPAEIAGQRVDKQRLMYGQYDGPFTINDVSGLFVKLNKSGDPEVKTNVELGVPTKIGFMRIPAVEQLKLVNGELTKNFITKDKGAFYTYRVKLSGNKPEITDKNPLDKKTLQQYLNAVLDQIKLSLNPEEATKQLDTVSHLLDDTEKRIFRNEAQKAGSDRKFGELSQLKTTQSRSKDQVVLSAETKIEFKEEIRNELSEEKPKEINKEKQVAKGKTPTLGKGKSNPRF